MATFTPILISTGLQLITSLFKKPEKAKEIDLRTPNPALGSEIPLFFGRCRLSGKIFFPKTTDKMYRVETKRSKGKGMASVENKTVYATWATLFCANQCSVDEIIINGKHINTGHSFYSAHCTFFDGTQTSAWAEASVLYPGNFEADIAYKGIAYIGFKDVNVESYGNTVPQTIDAILVDGRLGAEPSVGYVIQTICEEAGIPNSAIDITEIIPLTLKTGFNYIQSGEGFRDAIEQLMQFYQFSAVERDGVVHFKTFDRGATTGYIINPDHFLPVTDDMGNIASDGSKDRHFIRKKTDSQSLPNKITVKFFNQNKDFDRDVVPIPFGEYTKENIVNIDTTITSYPYEIEERGTELLKLNFLQNRISYSFRFPILYDFIESMDKVVLPNGETCQIQSKTNGNDFTISFEAFYYSGQRNYSLIPPYEQSPDDVDNLPDPTTIPDVYVLDIPQFEDNPPATLYILASGKATLNFSFDNGDSYPDTVQHLDVSTIGDCTTALPNATGLDVTNTLDVTVNSELEQITQNQFDNGQNLALLGTLNANGFYEGKLIRFRDVTVLGVNQYRLSYLFQGDYNTNQYDTSSLPLKFFLLRAPTTSYYSILVRNTANLSSPMSVLPVISEWQNLGTTPTTDITSFNNNSYIAPAVTNISAIKDTNDANANVQIDWDDSYSNTSPYKDGTEYIQYILRIYSDAGYTTLARTETVNETTYFYDGDIRIADSVGLPFYVEIARLSSVVGEGIVTQSTINPTLSGGLSGIIDADLLQGENGAYYLDRTNHTGTQPVSTISDFAEAVDDQVNNLLIAGNNITITYDDTLNTLTIDNDFSQEGIEDIVGNLIIGGNNITVTYNDTLNTLTIDNDIDLSVTDKNITANYTVLSTDDRLWLIVTTADITITLPNGFPTGFQVIVRNETTGDVNFAVEAGGTLNGVGTTIDTEGRVAHCYHAGGNLWRLTGYLV